MANTQDMGKATQMDTSDENATGPARILQGNDSTIAIKDKLYKKLGYKDSSHAPNMSQPFKQFEQLKKKRDSAHAKKEGA